MIDIKKLKIKTLLFYPTLEEQFENYDLKKLSTNTYQFKLDDSYHSPYVKIEKKDDYLFLTVIGSLKNWYFSKFDGINFSRTSMMHMMEILNIELNLYLPKNIYNAKLKNVKWDLNLLMDKKFSVFINCILEHKTLKRKSKLQQNEIIFSSKQRDLKITDDEILGRSDLRDKRLNKMGENNFMVSFKISDKQKSKNFSIKKFKKFNHLFDHWDYLINEYSRVVKNLVVTDGYGEEIANYIQNSTMNKMRDYAIYVGIKHYGIENFWELIHSKMNKKKAYEYKNKFKNIYDEFESINQLSLKTILDIKIDEQVTIMKK